MCFSSAYVLDISGTRILKARKRTGRQKNPQKSGSGKRMILKDGEAEKISKTLANILTKVQRGKVNIKGPETGIKCTGDRILHRLYSPS